MHIKSTQNFGINSQKFKNDFSHYFQFIIQCRLECVRLRCCLGRAYFARLCLTSTDRQSLSW